MKLDLRFAKKLIFLFLIALSGGSCGGTSDDDVNYQEFVQGMIENLEPALNEVRQELFDEIHPVGVAKKIKINDIKDVKMNSRGTELSSLTVIYTIYWEGPIESDGYTKVSAVLDTDVERWTEMMVISTNGITKAGIKDGVKGFAKDFAVGFVGGILGVASETPEE